MNENNNNNTHTHIRTINEYLLIDNKILNKETFNELKYDLVIENVNRENENQSYTTHI